MEGNNGETQLVNAETLTEIKRRITKLEDSDQRHEEDIRILYANQEGTKAYVSQILSKLESLETKLFGLVTNLASDQKKDRTEERKERSKTSQAFIEFAKYVIGITVGTVIVYILIGGGK